MASPPKVISTEEEIANDSNHLALKDHIMVVIRYHYYQLFSLLASALTPNPASCIAHNVFGLLLGRF